MNTFFKMASATALSAAALSVAALSVPAIQAEALKLLDKFNIDQPVVANITLTNKSIPETPVMEPIEIAFSDLGLLKAIAPDEENAGGSGVRAGAAGGGTSGSQETTGGGSGVIAGGGVPSGYGLGLGGSPRGGDRGADDSETRPGNEAAPGEQVITSDGDADSPGTADEPVIASKGGDTKPAGGGQTPNGGAGNTPLPGIVAIGGPTAGSPAPGSPGSGDSDTATPMKDVVAGIADLPSQPGDDVNGDPVAAPLAPILQAVAEDSEIPEPGTLALLGVGLLGLGAFRRQRAHR